MVGDVIYGKFTNDLPSATDLAGLIQLTDEQVMQLEIEKGEFENSMRDVQ